MLRNLTSLFRIKGKNSLLVTVSIMINDQHLARLRAHRSNIQRYRNLLQTSLTELERQFVQRRLTEEQSNLETLATSLPNDFRWSRAGRPESRLA
jgi:hypothetical protein